MSTIKTRFNNVRAVIRAAALRVGDIKFLAKEIPIEHQVQKPMEVP